MARELDTHAGAEALNAGHRTAHFCNHLANLGCLSEFVMMSPLAEIVRLPQEIATMTPH